MKRNLIISRRVNLNAGDSKRCNYGSLESLPAFRVVSPRSLGTQDVLHWNYGTLREFKLATMDA